MTWNIENQSPLNGKVIIVTGGNSGLGFEAVKMFALKEAKVIMATRSVERANEAIQIIKKDIPGADIEFMQLDLSSKQSIKKFSETFLSKYHKLDILLNNAGVMTTPFMQTEEKIEFQQGINHFGHFYLTALLFKTMKNTPKSRIVNVSSIAHRFGDMNFDNLLYTKEKSYNKMKAYARSKLENLLFTYELHKRVNEKGYDVKVIAAHPGVASTNLGRYIKSKKSTNTVINGFQKLFSHTAYQGALSLVRACLDETLTGGEFIGPNQFIGMKGLPHIAKSNKKSHNQILQKQLWAYSEELMKIDFYV